MAGYQPLYIKGMETGLVQSRQNFILPDDAYPVLRNAFLFREQLKRRQGLQILGRLRRVLTGLSLGLSDDPWVFNIWSTLVPPIPPLNTYQIEIGSVRITIGAVVLIDQGDGTLETDPPSGASGTIDYVTGDVVINGAPAGVAATLNINYFTGLPVMGLRSRELNAVNNEMLVAFDTVYAYVFTGGGWQEFIPGFTWSGTDSDFFWSTNFFVGDGNLKIFWVTNFSGTLGDPIRYTNGTTWIDFAPIINADGDRLHQCLCMLPFRGRMMVFNTLEGPLLSTSVNRFNRIRWSAIGTPFSEVSTIVSVVNDEAWRDDIRGQGGFLDIPTTEAIISVGFVRDNLVIYCERSTWQLRYTGRSIAPFQIEKVNTELGAESTFSTVQFDTSLLGVGDKGIVECDSFKSSRIDIKIPDFVFYINNENEGPKRVHGIRDFQQKLAYWIVPYLITANGGQVTEESLKFPNYRLVYNYENDSWALFTDSLTALGTYQPQSALRWSTSPIQWEMANFPWVNRPSIFPSIVGGNQQGYVLYLSSNISPQTTNDVSLTINNIEGFGADSIPPTLITSYDHNLRTYDFIQIVDLLDNDPFENLNNRIFIVHAIDKDSFRLQYYDPDLNQLFFQQNDPGTYLGGAQIKVRDNFKVQSKNFNFLDDGENIQLGYIDMLLNNNPEGGFSLNVYVDYDLNNAVNTAPNNNNPSTDERDFFFNTTIDTHNVGKSSEKFWRRVFCPVRGNFITLVYTFSTLQMFGEEQENDIQIDSQILWMRRAGKQLQLGD